MGSENDFDDVFDPGSLDDDFSALSVENAATVTLICTADGSRYTFSKGKLMEDSDYFDRLFNGEPLGSECVEINDEDPKEFAEFASHLKEMPDRETAAQETSRRLCDMSDEEIIDNLQHYQDMSILANRYETNQVRDFYKAEVFATMSHMVWEAGKTGKAEDADKVQRLILTTHFEPMCEAYSGNYPGYFDGSLVTLLTKMMDAFCRVGVMLNEIMASPRLTEYLFRIMLRRLIPRDDEELDRARAAGFVV